MRQGEIRRRWDNRAWFRHNFTLSELGKRGPLTAYEISKTIYGNDRTTGWNRVVGNTGIISNYLQGLEKDGLVKSEITEEHKGKVYSITKKGKKHLEDEKQFILKF